MFPTAVAGVPNAIVPPKVEAAQRYLVFAEGIRTGPMGCGSLPGDAPKDFGRELTKSENCVYESALEVLRLYFSGEQDFPISGMVATPPSDDGPNDRVPATN
jgi:hypothetical protein